uniref:tyrosine-protein kinase receptor TYRO3-like n=1 Tax=Myxine glutinosa TaxID=7769 RepID=UPI00358EF230
MQRILREFQISLIRPSTLVCCFVSSVTKAIFLYPQEVLDVGLNQYALLNISLPTVGNLTMQVLAYTNAGDGPPSESFTVSTHLPGEQVKDLTDKTWTPALVGILFVVLIITLIGLIVAGLRRRKDTAFGHHFCAISIRDEPVVSYRAQQSFSRHNEEVASKYPLPSRVQLSHKMLAC